MKKTLFNLHEGEIDIEQRFREIEIWMQLDDENIVHLHDIEVSLHENSLSVYTIHVGRSIIVLTLLRC